MPKSSLRIASIPSDEIDRQLLELERELQALAATVTTPLAKVERTERRGIHQDGRSRAGSRRAPAPSTIARGLAAAHAQPVSIVAAATVSPSPAVTAPAVGTDLGDPTRFGELPDQSRLEIGGGDREAFRQRLMAEVKRAQQILHTSGVRAAVWREWRAFEQSAVARLRSLE